MGLARARRKKVFVTACLTSFFMFCFLYDRSTDENVKKYTFYGGNYAKIHLLRQNETDTQHCDSETVILSSKLDSRHPWQSDSKCSKFLISHMIPYCRPPTALASFPGSGNTWLRFLIESATGVFTGSRYKDLQIQMYGLWGEIRSWEDGTTIVQKTHDASKHHVTKDFGGRAIIIVRNPYDAILSTHNFMYAGHHGKAPARNFARPDWHQFVTIQASKWLDMATNWTMHSSPKKVLVVHYENVKTDVLTEMRKILNFFNMPISEDRLKCLFKHKDGLFHREPTKTPEVVPFNPEIRKAMDNVINHVNENILKKRGYDPMPTYLYNFYQKTDEEILVDLRKKNQKLSEKLSKMPKKVIDDKESHQVRAHGTKMVLEQYVKWLDVDNEKSPDLGADATSTDDTKSKVMKELFKKFKQNSNSNTITGLSEKAEGILSKAVELWPILQRPFARDPVDDAIETDGFRGKKISDLYLPY